MKNPEVRYTVTSHTMDPVDVIAIVDGVEVPAKVVRDIIEATSSDGSMGHTFRIQGVDPDKFAVGKTFTAKLIPDG
jgi:hypothetical protein